MPIDSRIALGYQAPQIESPVNMMMAAQKMQSGQQENQLRQFQMQQMQQEAERTNQLRQTLSGIDLTTPEGQAQYGRALFQTGNVKEGQEYAASVATRTKAEREADLAKLTLGTTRTKIVAAEAGALMQDPTLDFSKVQSWAATHATDGFITLAAMQNLQAMQNARPEELRAALGRLRQQAVDADKQIELHAAAKRDEETNRHNLKMEGTATTAAQAAKAPTVTTIVDPTNPDRTLQIDARTYRGGSIGAPGVIGESVKQTQTAQLDARELAKREATYPQATTAVNAIESNTDALIAKLEALSKHPGLSGMTGLIAGRTPNLSADAREAQAVYDQIMAQGQFNVLQSLRETSKTGGALGNVSDTEGSRLRESFAPLKTTLSTESFQKGIAAAVADLKRTKRVVREGYDLTYEYKLGGKDRAAPPPAQNIPTVTSLDEARKLPSGTQFKDPNGITRVVP